MDDKTKRENFARLFPPAVEKLTDRLRVVKQKSAKGSYSWDQDLVHDTWVEIAKHFADCADAFGVQFEVLVDGTEVQYAEPKRKAK
jgi:hypothetical protein